MIGWLITRHIDECVQCSSTGPCDAARRLMRRAQQILRATEIPPIPRSAIKA